MGNKINQADINQALQYYKKGFTIVQSSKITGISQLIISKNIKLNNIKKQKGSGNRCQVDMDFFQKINTEEKAYWLGFITADGNIYKNRLEIKLASKDTVHLQKFLKSIKSSHKIHNGINICQNNKISSYSKVQIGSKKIINDLLKLGITSNKSLIVRPCEKIPQDLMNHYWRGIFDGDGSLNVQKSNKNGWRINLVGSEYIIKNFCDIVNKIANTQHKFQKRKNIFSITFGGLNCVHSILNYLYKDATIYLDRKYLLKEKCMQCELTVKKYPCFSIQEIEGLYKKYNNWNKVHKHLGITRSVLTERRRTFGLL